jgi:trimeric autotransporter adhesin
MRKIYMLLCAVVFFVTGSLAQNVTVAGALVGNGSYATLADAFTAINGGAQTAAAIDISIIASTTEPALGAILNAGVWATVTISPSGGAWTVGGTATSGLPLIDLNGADNVTINGLNSGGNALTIQNGNALTTSGTSTIRFIGGATSNTITNCTINGSASASVLTNGATIFFSTDAVTANGNDNNTISNNNIGSVGAALPTKAILGNGSTTTTAIGNSGIVITNNNIYDYFGAAVTSAGIATNGGCNTWSITNNRFYQSASRTWTTGALHNAINIGNTTATSGAQGFTITGNIVGYATNTQTGTYALTGVAGTFRAIVFTGITLGTVSNINNNTVASVSVTGVTSSGTSSSAPFMGIFISNGLVNTNNNTIGSQGATGSLVFSTTSASAAEMIGLMNFGVDSWTVNNNNIGGITVTNAGAGAGNATGIRWNTGGTVTTTISGNTIGGTIANSIQSTSIAAAAQVIGINALNAITNASLNTIRNLTGVGGTGTTTGASVIGINVTTATPNHTISQNTIFNLSNTNATAATTVTGIQFTGGGANIVQRNNIYGLTSATTSTTAEINGIRVAGGTTIYRNNMIVIGAGVTNAIGAAASNSSTAGINGIMEFLGTNSFFHNSVYIGGAPTAGVGASIAFNGAQTVNVRSFRDNIFFNARSNSGATGKNYAVKINGTTVNPTGLTINNNVYFANGSGAVFGFFNSLDVANIAAWKLAVGQDAGSFESNPQYNDPTNAVPDLHLHPTNATVAEGNGVDLGVIDDFDGQTRSGLTPVDIGADAGNFNGIDLAAPNITFTPLLFICTTGDRTLTATITDISGVPTSGTLQPRIYYRKNAGTWFSSQGVLASGTGTNGTWTMTIVAADMGGLVVTDNVQYYVIAQDIAGTPNISSNPAAGLVATNVNTVTTAPTTPNNYNISNNLSGIYTVGGGGTYPTITAAFNAYNTNCLTGPVVFNLIDAVYTTTSDTLRTNPFANSTNTLTIKPNAAGTVINGNLNGPAIVLLDADYITIDGSTTGAMATACTLGGTAALRELTISNTNIGTNAAVISIASMANGAQNNTVKNVNILGQDALTSLIGISIGGITLGSAGADNDDNKIINCSVKRSIFGIYSAGASLANQNTGTIITKNDISATATDRVSRVGILVFSDNGAQITENSIGGLSITTGNDAVGIGLGTQAIDNANTTSGGVTNALVSRNKINGVASLSATGFSAAGIAVAGAVGGANTISNNMITGVTAPATSPDLATGIFIAGVTGANNRLYFNSVSMTGDRGAVAAQMPSYCIAITGVDPVVDLRNNILYTTQIASGGGVDAKSYAIGMVTTTFVNLNDNYNNYWSTGANDGGFRTGSLSPAAGIDYATIALFATAVADEANSLEANPNFVNDLNDLHITTTNCSFDGKGIVVTGITNDIDCQLRSTSIPDIGADEYSPIPTATTVISLSGDAVTYPISSTTSYMANCRIIAEITPGTVAGNVLAKTTIVPAGVNGVEPFGPRVTDLEPTIDGTGTVKLYFKQSEFTAYNTYLAGPPVVAYTSAPTSISDVANAANVRVRQFHGANATFVTNTGTDLLVPTSTVYDAAGDNGAGWWVVTVNAPSFSSFYQTTTPIVTPVTLSNIRGELTGATNTVYWSTATESNSNKFVVQRSTNGSSFTTIGEVATKAINGNSNTILNYSFIDANPVQGKAFYKLQIVDNSNAIKYSPIVTLRRGAGKLEIVDVRPNPTTGTVYFNVLGTSGNVTVAITDLTGKLVINKGLVQSNNFSVDMSGLANGMYILAATDSRTGEKSVFKVLKN